MHYPTITSGKQTETSDAQFSSGTPTTRHPALEYMDDLPLQFDALLAMMEGTSDPTLLLQSISKRFVNLAVGVGSTKMGWIAVAHTLEQVLVVWNNGEKEEALRIVQNVRSRCDKYVNLEEITDVERVFAENAGFRVELVLTTSLKSVPIIMRSIESGNMTALNSAIHDADSLANVLLSSGGSLLKELLFFVKLGRDLKSVKSTILTENVVHVNFVGQQLPFSVSWKAQAVALLTRIDQALVNYSASLAGQRPAPPQWVTAAIGRNRRAFILSL